MTDNVELALKVKDLVVQAFVNDAATFDDFYTAFYGVKLAGHDCFKVDRARQAQGERVASLRALLNIDLQKFNPRLTFDESLINEYDIADLMNFIGALREMIPYSVVVETLGLGCIWMEYGIYGNRPRRGRLPFLDKAEIEAVLNDEQRSEPSFSTASNWDNLKQRFHAQLELQIN